MQIKTLPIESTFDAIMDVSEIVDCLHSYDAILNKVSSSEEANEAYIYPKKDKEYYSYITKYISDSFKIICVKENY